MEVNGEREGIVSSMGGLERVLQEILKLDVDHNALGKQQGQD